MTLTLILIGGFLLVCTVCSAILLLTSNGEEPDTAYAREPGPGPAAGGSQEDAAARSGGGANGAVEAAAGALLPQPLL